MFKALHYVARTKESFDVRLELTTRGIQVTNAKGRAETLAYSDLDLVPVGYLDSQTILRAKSTGDTFISPDMKLLHALQNVARGDLQQQIQKRMEKHKQDTFSILSGWSILVFVLISLAVFTLYATGAIVDI